MTGGRLASWVRKHYVALYFALAVLWLAFAAIQIIAIVDGDPGTNGGHVFGLVLSLLVAVLSAISAVIALIAKRKKSTKGQSA